MLIIWGGTFRMKVLIFFSNFSIYKIIRKVKMSQQFCSQKPEIKETKMAMHSES